MSRRLSIPANLRWTALPALVIKPLWFLFILWSTRVLGPEEFGRTMLAISFVSILAVLLEGGIDIMLVRRLAERPEDAAALLGRTLPIKMAISILFVLAAVLLQHFYPIAGISLALVLAGGVVVGLGQINNHLRAVFRAFETMSRDAISTVFEKLALVVCCGIALGLAPSALSFLSAQAVALFLTLIATAAVVWRAAGRPRWRFDTTDLWREVFQPALPFALMNIFIIIYFRSGTLALSVITRSDELVGYYNAGYRLVEAFMLVPALIMTPMYPVFVRTAGERPAVAWRLQECLRVVLFLSLMTAGLLVLFPEEATRLFFGSEFALASSAIGIMALAMFPIGLNFVFGTLVAAVGRQSRANFWILTVTAINIALNILLIRAQGLTGAAWTTLVTESLLAAGNLFMVRDYVPWRAVLGIGGRVLGALILAALLVRLGPGNPAWFPWNAAAIAGMLLILMALTRIVSRRDLVRLAGRD